MINEKSTNKDGGIATRFSCQVTTNPDLEALTKTQHISDHRPGMDLEGFVVMLRAQVTGVIVCHHKHTCKQDGG